MKNLLIEILTLIIGGIIFVPLFIIGVLYTIGKHIYKLDYSICRQLATIVRNVTLILDGLANSGAGELMNDVYKIEGKIRFGKYYETISSVVGLLYLNGRDTKLRRVLDKALESNHCVSSIKDEQLLYYKNNK